MKWKPFVIAAAGLLLIPLGCTRSSIHHIQPEERPRGSEFTVAPIPRPNDYQRSEAPEAENPLGTVTLDEALSLALRQNPDLAGVSWDVQAKEGLAHQAALFPNPEIEVEIENVGGQDERSDFESAESTVLLSQLLELGGKRSHRSQVAIFETELARWDYELQRLDIIEQTTNAFIDVLAAQERLHLAKQIFRLSGQVFKTVSKRVEAGKVSPLEQTKASVSFTTSKMELLTAERNLKSAGRFLASRWGTQAPRFQDVSGDLYALTMPPSQEAVNARLFQSPEIARWNTKLDQCRAAIALQESQRIPDLTLAGGVRRYEDTDDYGFVFGAALPLPLIDRNQGNIVEAQSMMSKAEYERAASEINLRTELAASYEDLSRSYTVARMLREDVLPAAQSTFDAAQKGFQEGKFSYLEVLDAQRTFFKAERQYLESASQHQKLKATVERLIGRPLANINDATP